MNTNRNTGTFVVFIFTGDLQEKIYIIVGITHVNIYVFKWLYLYFIPPPPPHKKITNFLFYYINRCDMDNHCFYHVYTISYVQVNIHNNIPKVSQEVLCTRAGWLEWFHLQIQNTGFNPSLHNQLNNVFGGGGGGGGVH